MSRFKSAVINVILQIPKGTVASYGQVALYVGVPRAARQVGWILRGIEEEIELPWWRVINNAGRISIKGNKYNTPELQRKLLESEGIEIKEDFTFNIHRYRWIPNDTTLVSFGLDEEYIQMLHKKYFTADQK